MPGEFYIKGKKEKTDLSQVLADLDQLEIAAEAIKSSTDKLAGEVPGNGSITADWQIAETDIVMIGAEDVKHKLHSLLLGIQNLAGTVITVSLYMPVNGVERKVYEQPFNATTDPTGLWIVNGTVGIHEILSVTLQSNDAAHNSKAVDYDYLLEAMQ